jgi:predicted regulator of Ras-like GTPase activity (Roadblock/LC7/MglB family)
MSASSPNGGSHGLFGYLKGLFRRGDESNNTDNNGEDTSILTAALPLVPPPVEVGLASAADASAEFESVSNAETNSNVDTRDGGVTPGVVIPLQSVLNGLPAELRDCVRVQTVGDATLSVPLDKVLAQLAQGQVRIPFGDVRKAAQHVFAPGADFDRISVALPLNEILSRLNPALLVRRSVARQIEIPDEIASPFAGRGEGLSFSVGNAKSVPPATPQKAAPAPTVPVRGSISSVARPTPPAATAMANIPAPFQYAPPKPAAPTPSTALPSQPIPFNSNGTPSPIRQVSSTPAAPAAQMQPAVPPAKPQPVAVPPPVAAPTIQAVITTPLSGLIEAWPESLRLEILQTKLGEARIALPVDLVETALKRGRVTFSWKTIRSWVTPAMPTSVSVHDSAELELPLQVIAPLFLNRKRAASGGQQKISVDAGIPNLFFGFPQSETPAPVAPAGVPKPAGQAIPFAPIPFNPSPAVAAAASASASAAVAAAAAATAAAAANAAVTKPADAKLADTNYYLWDDVSDTQIFHIEALKQKGSSSTEFVKRYASPNEIVSRAAALEGVAGVLIALPDGLMVASRLPGELNGDTLAAFLPQIYSKVSACTKELRMGDLNNVSFTVGNVPWKIFRVNAIFFAAFGHAAQPMPTAQLAGLAAELDRKNK